MTVVIEGRARQVRLSRRALLQAVAGSLVAPFVGVDAALGADTAHVDPALVEHFAMLRSVLVESDNRVGAAAILPTARQQLGHIAGFRAAARGDLHDAFLRTEARWAEFAGWLSDDLGDRVAGDWWLAQALTMAQEVGDAEFTTYVFARMAQRAAEATDRDRVLGLARAAGCSGNGRGQVRAFAALQRAHGHAIAGNTAGFQAAVDDAHHLVAGAVDDGGSLGSFCTTAYVWAQEGDGWHRLGRPRAAVGCFNRALDAWPDSYRRERGLYLARTAAAYAAAGEPGRAAAAALAALELGRLTRSARTTREVTAVGSQLTAVFPTEPGVADLRVALAASPQPT
ncbi:XRE family transcriptional regulator [Micromonospora sp. NPDC048830]|uniref:XRE family transcriptional regulator n=1 Tax=Micromonospora sp. NPDC048830 TaxID=3364257 RepID=UPI00371F25FC